MITNPIKILLRRFVYRLRAEYTIEMLIKMGMRAGKNFNPQHGTILDPSHCWLIAIGDDVTMGPRVHVLAHDTSTKFMLGYTKIGRVNIGNNVFIGAESVILPNVTIGDNVIIGANSTVSKNIPSNSVYAGNPAKHISSFESFVEKNRNLMKQCACYDESFTIRENITSEKKKQMIEDLSDKFGFVL
jgi:maltose O-acetyltransferase